MRNECLGALDDPREITDAELVCFEQGRRDCEPGRIGEGTGEPGRVRGELTIEAAPAQPLRDGKIEAEKLAAIGRRHSNTLTSVGMIGRLARRALPIQLRYDSGGAPPSAVRRATNSSNSAATASSMGGGSDSATIRFQVSFARWVASREPSSTHWP